MNVIEMKDQYERSSNHVHRDGGEEYKVIEENGNKYRAVFFRLACEEENWEKIGMGYCEYEEDEKRGNGFIRILPDTGSGEVFDIEISSGTTYVMQRESVIVWYGYKNEEGQYALSFEDKAGCEMCWNLIHRVQTKSLSSIMGGSIDVFDQDKVIDLPGPEVVNLKEIEKTMREVNMSLFQRFHLSHHLLSSGYIDKLFEMFELCKELDSKEDLEIIVNIFEQVVFSCNASMLEYLIKDENISRFVSVFRYDPILKKTNTYMHGLHFIENFKLKEIVPMNVELRNNVISAHRLRGLREYCIFRYISDSSNSVLNSLIKTYYMNIFDALEQDKSFLASIGNMILETDQNIQKDIIMFLIDLLFVLQAISKESYFLSFVNLDSVMILMENILSIDEKDATSSTYLLLSEMQIVFSGEIKDYIIRDFKLSDHKMTKIIPHIIRNLHSARSCEAIIKLGNIMSSFLVYDTLSLKHADFLDFFYSQHMAALLSPFDNLDSTKIQELDEIECEFYREMCNLVSRFIETHTYRIKYYILENPILQNVLKLLSSKTRHLVLGSVRVLRTILGQKDDFYDRYIVKHRLLLLLHPLLTQYIEEDGLLSSAMLDMFEYIRTRNSRIIVTFVVDHLDNEFSHLKHTNIFTKIVDLHGENQKSKDDNPIPPPNSHTRNAWNTLSFDASEEEYYNKSDEESDAMGLCEEIETSEYGRK